MISLRLSRTRRSVMQIRLASIPVDDQEKALNFYTKIVGFVNKGNITKGGADG